VFGSLKTLVSARLPGPGRLLGTLLIPALLSAQILEFWSNGLKYQALTREGLTLMYAHLPVQVGDYAVVQAAFNNGSAKTWLVRPGDFVLECGDGRKLQALSEDAVIKQLYRSAGREEVIELRAAYEKALYGNEQLHRNDSVFEERRRSALAMGNKGAHAAAAAATIVLAETELTPGASLDGAVFFRLNGKSLQEPRLVARIASQTFEFRRQQAPRIEAASR